MEDDVDLYAGLAEDLTAPSAFELSESLDGLKEQLAALQKKLEVSDKKVELLTKQTDLLKAKLKKSDEENGILKTNISTLYVTAKAEIDRKNSEIESLKEQIKVFRGPRPSNSTAKKVDPNDMDVDRPSPRSRPEPTIPLSNFSQQNASNDSTSNFGSSISNQSSFSTAPQSNVFAPSSTPHHPPPNSASSSTSNTSTNPRSKYDSQSSSGHSSSHREDRESHLDRHERSSSSDYRDRRH